MSAMTTRVPQISDAPRRDSADAARALAVALAHSPIGRSLGPNSDRSIGVATDFFTALLDAMLPDETVRVARVGGQVVGAAVWLKASNPVGYPIEQVLATAGASGGFRALVSALTAKFPRVPDPHRVLAFVGVMTRHRRKGIASLLATDPPGQGGATAVIDANSWQLFRAAGLQRGRATVDAAGGDTGAGDVAGTPDWLAADSGPGRSVIGFPTSS